MRYKRGLGWRLETWLLICTFAAQAKARRKPGANSQRYIKSDNLLEF